MLGYYTSNDQSSVSHDSSDFVFRLANVDSCIFGNEGSNFQGIVFGETGSTDGHTTVVSSPKDLGSRRTSSSAFETDIGADHPSYIGGKTYEERSHCFEKKKLFH